MHNEHEESDTTTARITASEYINRIKQWQMDNGGFRRMPPRSYDVKLYNWLQRCKFDYKTSTLNQAVGEHLLALGMLTDDLGEEKSPSETQSDYDTAIWAISTLKRMGAEDMNGPTGEGLRVDRCLSTWIDNLKVLAANNPNSNLLNDLRWKIPRVFALEVEPHISKTSSFRIERRSPEDQTKDAYQFVKRKNRLPDLLSEDIKERKMASWIVRMETGFESISWEQLTKTKESEKMVEFLQATISVASAKQREAQWRWWSSVAMEVMRNPKEGSRWQDQVFTEEPEMHAEKLGVEISSVRSGKPGWKGGVWGVDIMCVSMASGKAAGSSGKEKRKVRAPKDDGYIDNGADQ